MSFFSVNAQTIFDNLTPLQGYTSSESSTYANCFSNHTHGTTALGCDTSSTLPNGASEINVNLDPVAACLADKPNHSGSSYFGDNGSTFTPIGSPVTNPDGSTTQQYQLHCQMQLWGWSNFQFTHDYTVYTTSSSGGCPADSISHDGLCYSAIAVEQADSCTPSNAYLAFNSTDDSVCHTKADGSQCHFEKTSSNGSDYYTQSLEPSSCYDNEYPDYSEPTTEPSGYDCQDIGNGVTACPESPENVCGSDGTCATGCGNVTFNGNSHFMCFSDDTDLDGLGDYADPDIDGDGIANNLDIDADGDGNDDRISASQLVGSGFSSAPSSQDIADDISDKLIELGDFDIESSVNAVDDAISNTDTSVDALLNDANFDFKSTITDSNYDTSLNALTATLAPTACVNTFSIPFTNKTLDICSAAEKAKPFLFFIFAFSSVYYCYIRINQTARGV